MTTWTIAAPTSSSTAPRRRSCSSCELRSVRPFCNLEPHALRELEQLGMQAEFRRGSVMFHEGDPPRNVMVLCEGQVKLSCISRDGRTHILKIAMPGDVLGLGAVISGEPYEVTAEAALDCRVLMITRVDFLRLLGDHGQASMHAAQALSSDYRTAFLDARRLSLSGSVAARVANLLLDWSRAGSCDAAVPTFQIGLSHEELGSIVGSSRETVTRVLSKFRKDGLIATEGMQITLLDKAELERLAD